MKCRVTQFTEAEKKKISEKTTEYLNDPKHKDQNLGIKDFGRGIEIPGKTLVGDSNKEKQEKVAKDIAWFAGGESTKLYEQVRDVAPQTHAATLMEYLILNFNYLTKQFIGAPRIDYSNFKIRYTINEKGEKFLNVVVPISHITPSSDLEPVLLDSKGKFHKLSSKEADNFSVFNLGPEQEKSVTGRLFFGEAHKIKLGSRQEELGLNYEPVPLIISTMRFKITEDNEHVNYELVDANLQINTPKIKPKKEDNSETKIFEKPIMKTPAKRFKIAPAVLFAIAAIVLLPFTIWIGLGLAFVSIFKAGREWIRETYKYLHNRVAGILDNLFPKNRNTVDDPLYLIKKDNENVEQDMPGVYEKAKPQMDELQEAVEVVREKVNEEEKPQLEIEAEASNGEVVGKEWKKRSKLEYERRKSGYDWEDTPDDEEQLKK